MRNLHSLAYVGLAFGLLASVVSCGRSSPKRPVFGVSLPAGTEVNPSIDKAGVVTGEVGANSSEVQLLKASSSSNIANVSVAFPVGSLGISTSITLKEGAPLDSDLLAGELALDTARVSASGAAVMISSSKPIDLKKPMILALPLPVGLSLAVAADTIKRLGVVYRIQSQESGDNIVGFAPASELKFDNNNNILYPSKYFGWFQVVAFDREVERTQRLATLSLHEGVEIVLLGMTMPSCGKADLGRTVYVQDSSRFEYCAADGWKVIDLKGPTGIAGAAGEKGPQGDAGPAGPAGNPLYVFDPANRNAGLFLSIANNAALVKIGSTAADIAIYGLDVSIGTVNPTCVAGLSCKETVYYQGSDCSGTPFWAVKPIKNALVVSGSSYFRATGAESAAPNGSYTHYTTGTSCIVTSISGFNTYTVTTPYALPSNQVAPLTISGPLSIGPN